MLENSVKRLGKKLKSILKVKMVVKLSSCFNIKERKLIQHEHDLVYKIMCPDCPAT